MSGMLDVSMFKSLYIHFPYCLYKCHYCDFNSYAYKPGDIPNETYQQALKSEIQHKAKNFLKSKNIETIFWGGGTPSLMPAAHIEDILQTVDRTWGIAANAEITLECNPGTVSLQKFADFKKAGINRISLGVQSFHEKNLQRFGRIHSGDEAKQALEAACQVFENVSCDLIFGFPDGSFLEWQNDLATACQFGLKHISCYALTAEPQTQYAFDLRSGKYNEVPHDTFADMQMFTYDYLERQGFVDYEISNFAKPGHESRHNLCYWHYESYAGLGAGACSQSVTQQNGSVLVSRFMNHKRPQNYCESVLQNQDFFSREDVFAPDSIFEYLMMNLRLREGVNKNTLQNFCGETVFRDLSLRFQDLVRQGLLVETPSHWRVTRQGFLLNHKLLASFFDWLKQ